MTAHRTLDRFWSKVDTSGECWVWTASTNGRGYGQFYTGGPRMETAHRHSWQIAYGSIPEGMFVCHRCDNRLCVRPDHLFLGTARDNNVDMVVKGRGRWKGTCKRGHDLDVYGVPANRGRSRRCRLCKRGASDAS